VTDHVMVEQATIPERDAAVLASVNLEPEPYRSTGLRWWLLAIVLLTVAAYAAGSLPSVHS
jgi:hypothetical protein